MNTQWFVIDGIMSSGKSTLIRQFRRKGFKMIPEAARAIIVEGRKAGKSIEEIRVDELTFNRAILARKILTEATLPTSEVIGLDRGIPSSMAYYRAHGFDPTEAIEACFTRKYRTVFIMEPLPLTVDYARTDHQIAERLHPLMIGAYEAVGYTPILVPTFSTDKAVSIRERVRFITERL